MTAPNGTPEPPVPATEAPATEAMWDALEAAVYDEPARGPWLVEFVRRLRREAEARAAQPDRVAALEGALARFIEAAEHTHKMGRVTAALDASMFEARALLAPPAPAREWTPLDMGERGGESPDYMCPNCVTPWKCNGPHIPEPAPARNTDPGDTEP